MPNSVPFLDLARMHRELRAGLLEEFGALIDTSPFINGPDVVAFEEEFAAYCGVAHAVGLASGLDALRLCLQALGLGAGDEVIVPAMTFVATWEAVSQIGAVPVPVDVSETDYCIHADAIAAAVTDRTRVVMPVHLYGQLADLPAIEAVAGQHGLLVLEDAAQAHGARRDGRGAGSSGAPTAFSFYPGKNLGAMGDAGALTTGDAELAARVRSLREHGQRRKYEHDEIGWTARLDTMQAIVLRHKLRRLDAWNAERREQAAFYNEALTGVGDLVMPPVALESEPVWHLYVVRTADPDGLAANLRDRGIGTGRHYPQPPHRSAAYADLGLGEGEFPVAEEVARGCLSLPVYPGLSESELEQVVHAVRSSFADG